MSENLTSAWFWWGAILMALAAILIFVIVQAFPCIDAARVKDGSLILQSIECKANWASKAYLVIYDLQTGIGAGIAVLGVVWSGFFVAKFGAKVGAR